MPLNTVSSIKNFYAKFEISNGPLSKESNGFESWLDPLAEKRHVLVKTQGINIIGKVSSRLKALLRAHILHPALVMHTTAQENDEIWFKDMEPSGITVECLLLRGGGLSGSEHLDELSPASPNSEILQQNDYTEPSRSSIIKDVMRSYTALCAFDPYLNVPCSFLL